MFKRHLLLGILFLMLFMIGIQFLEMIESRKVMPFEHVELGITYSLFIGFTFYICAFLPLNVIIEFFPATMTWNVVRITANILVGIFMGSYIFFMTYPEWVEIDGYPVQEETSIIIFVCVAFIYTSALIIYKKKE